MLDAESWSEPEIEWSAPGDLAAIAGSSGPGELLAVWPPAPFESAPTHCYRLDDEYSIVQAGVGTVRFRADAPRIVAFPSASGNPDWFRDVVTRCWLPAIYPFWGRQVLHASAVAIAGGDNVVALTGPTHTGKSTTAYALGRRVGWRLVADDSLAFAWSPAERSIRIHPLQNEARLRPASVEYFRHEAGGRELVQWPGGRLTLRVLLVLDGHDGPGPLAAFTRLAAAESLPLLLQQAFALSFAVPEYNRQLLMNYAQLAAVPTFRLRYRRSFDAAALLYDAIEDHVTTQVPVSSTPPATRGHV